MPPPCRPSPGPIGGRTTRPLPGRLRVLATAVVACLAAVTASAQLYPATLTYDERGNRNEGLVGEPKAAGATLTLMSAVAVVRPAEGYDRWPAAMRLRFYLPKGEELVNVAVRQVPAPNGFYRLDRLRPAKPWVAGATNDFEWPTDLMARIFDFQAPSQVGVTRAQWVAQLGVVVTLRSADSRAVSERQATVAPATLFHASQPGDVGAYQFTFRPTASADVKEFVVSEATKRSIPLTPRAVDANGPFTTRWVPDGQPEGWYQLTCNVGFRGPDAGTSQQWVFRFYHRPSLRL